MGCGGEELAPAAAGVPRSLRLMGSLHSGCQGAPRPPGGRGFLSLPARARAQVGPPGSGQRTRTWIPAGAHAQSQPGGRGRDPKPPQTPRPGRVEQAPPITCAAIKERSMVSLLLGPPPALQCSLLLGLGQLSTPPTWRGSSSEQVLPDPCADLSSPGVAAGARTVPHGCCSAPGAEGEGAVPGRGSGARRPST